MAYKTETEIKKKVQDLQQQLEYLQEFLTTCYYKDFDVKAKVEKELIPLRRELNMLRWVINEDNLPF